MSEKDEFGSNDSLDDILNDLNSDEGEPDGTKIVDEGKPDKTVTENKKNLVEPPEQTHNNNVCGPNDEQTCQKCENENTQNDSNSSTDDGSDKIQTSETINDRNKQTQGNASEISLKPEDFCGSSNEQKGQNDVISNTDDNDKDTGKAETSEKTNVIQTKFVTSNDGSGVGSFQAVNGQSDNTTVVSNEGDRNYENEVSKRNSLADEASVVNEKSEISKNKSCESVDSLNNEQDYVSEDDTNLENTDKNVSRSYSVKSNDDESHVITQYLGQCSDDAEARLLARRQARAEAREIRMRELERQQKEQEENADRQYDMLEASSRTTRTTGNRYLSSRRSSEDSLEDGGSLREMRHELKEVEEKFRKAMIANAQLDNDKAAQTYQLELLKDRLEELEEEHLRLRREHRDKCREHDQLKRLAARLKEDLAVTKFELDERDRLITEKGLVIVVEEIEEEIAGASNGGDTSVNSVSSTPKKALVSVENAQLLESVGEGSLDVRLARFGAEKKELQDQISHLRLELEEERSKRRKSSGVTLNGPTCDSDYDADDAQKDIVRQLADYKFRAQKAEQDVATLQTNVARLETQVIRYKTEAEMYEKSEEALKQEKRKLQREAREAQNRAEELETSNTHLLKRLDKLKNAKSALLKEL